LTPIKPGRRTDDAAASKCVVRASASSARSLAPLSQAHWNPAQALEATTRAGPTRCRPHRAARTPMSSTCSLSSRTLAAAAPPSGCMSIHSAGRSRTAMSSACRLGSSTQKCHVVASPSVSVEWPIDCCTVGGDVGRNTAAHTAALTNGVASTRRSGRWPSTAAPASTSPHHTARAWAAVGPHPSARVDTERFTSGESCPGWVLAPMPAPPRSPSSRRRWTSTARA